MRIKYDFYVSIGDTRSFMGWLICFWRTKYVPNGFGWRLFGYQGFVYFKLKK